jgi:hypothetical protein
VYRSIRMKNSKNTTNPITLLLNIEVDYKEKQTKS